MKKSSRFAELRKLSPEIPNGRFKIGTLVFPLLVYFALYIAVRYTSELDTSISFGSEVVPLSAFTGIFALLQSAVIMFIVIFYRKAGIVTTSMLMGFQLFGLVNTVFGQHLYSAISGMVSIVINFVLSIVIYNYMNKIDKYQEELCSMAVIDSLTELPNRRASSKYISDVISGGEKFALVMIDINNFKKINDSVGHEIGNEVLVEISRRWNEVKNSDECSCDFIARQGGDEFILVLRGYENDAELREKVDKYITALNDKICVHDCEAYLTASYGYAEFPTDTKTVSQLFAFADTAMYCAKREKNNGLVKFSREMNAEIEKTFIIEKQIREAIDTKGLYFVLQPQYYTATHKLRGFEALARMKAGDVAVSPADFIPVAEKIGIIDYVDRSVMCGAIDMFSRLIRETGTDVTLSVNVSVSHLLQKGFVKEITDIIGAYDMPPHQLEIEITESLMIVSAEEAVKCLTDLKKLGVKVAIDDFGTGYSSLSYLNTIPADILKVDKSFIDKMNSEASGRQYVSAIISIGHIMNFSVISEGVEDPEQIETLKAIGCDIVQGYIWGKPLMPDTAEALVKQEPEKSA